MLVYQFRTVLPGTAPAPVILRTSGKGPAAANHPDLRMLRFDGVIKQRIPVKECLPHFLVADGQVLQAEGLRMSHLRPLCTPRRIRRALSKFDEIQGILDKLL